MLTYLHGYLFHYNSYPHDRLVRIHLRKVQHTKSTRSLIFIVIFIIILFLFLFLQDIGDGWWEARNSEGQQGLIPETYVEVSFFFIITKNVSGHTNCLEYDTQML